jgi:hypothetical protein
MTQANTKMMRVTWLEYTATSGAPRAFSLPASGRTDGQKCELSLAMAEQTCADRQLADEVVAEEP